MNSADSLGLQQSQRIRRTSWDVGRWLCLLIAIYFGVSLSFAVLNFERYGTAAPQFLRYILGPALIMSAFVIMPLVADRKKTLLIGIYAASILGALFLAEAFLTIRTVPILQGSLGQLDDQQRQELNDDETMIRGFTLRRLNKLAKVDTLAESRLSGFADAKTLLCSTEDGMRMYTADRYGFNNADSVYDRAVDLALIGDSFTEGFCLPEGEDVASELRGLGTNTVNLGIRGNGPLIELATIGRFGPTLRPKHVVMAYYEGNDWRNLGFELTEPWLRETLDPDADFGSILPAAPETEHRTWELMQTLTQDSVTGLDLLLRTPLLRNFFALYRTGQPLGLIYPKVPTAIPEFEDVLRRAKEIAKGWNGSFSLLYIPDRGRYGSLLPTGFTFDQLRGKVIVAAEAANVDVIDLVSIFEDYGDPRRFYAPDGHFSEEGAEFVAATLEKSMDAR